MTQHAQFRELLEDAVKCNPHNGNTAKYFLDEFDKLPDVAAELDKIIKDIEKSNNLITFREYKESPYLAGKRDTFNYILTKLKELSK